MLEHGVTLLDGQEKKGRLGSMENPVGSSAFTQKCAVQVFGTLLHPMKPWAFVRTDGCQYGMVSQAVDDGSYGMAVEKGQLWLANFDTSLLSLRCKKPDALAVAEHQHRPVRGFVKVACDDGEKHWVSAGSMSGIYPQMLCDAYWRCAKKAIAGRKAERAEGRPCCHVSDSLIGAVSSGSGPGIPDLVAVADHGKEEGEIAIPESDVNVSADLTPQERETLKAFFFFIPIFFFGDQFFFLCLVYDFTSFHFR